ncbi:MAG: purine-nucleoside phosphorylase [Minisyncoccia bacterium]
MSIHINAKEGEIAETVFLSGDPLRAKFIAENYLKDVFGYNSVRGMYGYTGITKEGKRVSVQGTGMGMPSLSIYVNELIDSYKVKRLIRVGSAGSLQKELKTMSIVLALGSCSDSAMNLSRFPVGAIFAPVADWELLKKANEIAEKKKIEVKVGNIFAADKFYDSDTFYGSETWKVFAKYNVLAVEMETAELYTLAAQKGVQALTMLTISDNLVTGDKLSSKDRETAFTEMIEIALAL